MRSFASKLQTRPTSLPQELSAWWSLPIRAVGFACCVWSIWQLSGFATDSFGSTFREAFLGFGRAALMWPDLLFSGSSLDDPALSAEAIASSFSSPRALLARLLAINIAIGLIAVATHGAIGLASFLKNRRVGAPRPVPAREASLAFDQPLPPAERPEPFAAPTIPLEPELEPDRMNVKRRVLVSNLFSSTSGSKD